MAQSPLNPLRPVHLPLNQQDLPPPRTARLQLHHPLTPLTFLNYKSYKRIAVLNLSALTNKHYPPILSFIIKR